MRSRLCACVHVCGHASPMRSPTFLTTFVPQECSTKYGTCSGVLLSAAFATPSHPEVCELFEQLLIKKTLKDLYPTVPVVAFGEARAYGSMSKIVV